MPHHTISSGVDQGAYQRAIVAAAALAATAGVDVIYLSPTLKNVDGDTPVAVFGKKQVAAFLKNREMTMNGARFHLETALTMRTAGPAIVLAVYLSEAHLAKAIADHRTADWVYVPWAEQELAIYLRAHPKSVAV
jgi:hypothetical protein